MRKLLDFIGWPITAGILIALLALTLFPQLRQRLPGQALLQQPPIQQQVVSYADAVRQAAPGVVNIYTTKKVQLKRSPLHNHPYFRRYQERRVNNSLGSGVIASSDGYILTNNHVIEGADTILVQLSDGRSTSATLVGTDPDSDLAVLKVEASGLTPPRLRSSSEIQVGDVVLAIGNPFGVGQTVSQGIISATGRGLVNLTSYTGFFQTDAAINPGNSGGALVDAYGNLIGISTAILNTSGASGISFAIPADYALKALQDITEYGVVVRGWLGFDANELTPALAKSFGLSHSDGFVITNVTTGAPAHQAGLQPGDVVTHIDNIALSNGLAGMQRVTQTRPGTQLR
ncbi:MAG: trypsin-like peptidase domain-containing protein, partial [Cellvibrionaceae bacterium]|nr:trypsin-like peptidase domain-containing protein [Cellvibrionaceae bacterium]